jgi:hypothetical protein
LPIPSQEANDPAYPPILLAKHELKSLFFTVIASMRRHTDRRIFPCGDQSQRTTLLIDVVTFDSTVIEMPRIATRDPLSIKKLPLRL